MNRSLRAVIALGCMSFSGSAVQAQHYPSKPIRIIVSAAPGGANDVIVRAVAQRLSVAWGQTVVVENKPGGNNQIAGEHVAKSAPDGYTLLSCAEGAFVVNPYLYSKLSYDPVKDFVPVSGLGLVRSTLVVHPSLPAWSIRDLIALAKTKPGELTYTTNGPGSAPHLNMELLQRMAEIKLAPVHYRGGAPALADVIGGHVQMMFISVGLMAPPWKAGQVRALGVGSSKRLTQFPELPTIAESGVPGFEAVSWFGLWAPTATPNDILVKLNAEVQRILSDAAFREQFLGPNFYEPITGTPEQFATYIQSEATKWSKLIKEANIKTE